MYSIEKIFLLLADGHKKNKIQDVTIPISEKALENVNIFIGTVSGHYLNLIKLVWSS